MLSLIPVIQSKLLYLLLPGRKGVLVIYIIMKLEKKHPAKQKLVWKRCDIKKGENDDEKYCLFITKVSTCFTDGVLSGEQCFISRHF